MSEDVNTVSDLLVAKRNGKSEKFNSEKIEKAILNAMKSSGIKSPKVAFNISKEIEEELKEKGYKLAVCSNASNWELDVILKKLEVKDYFDVIQGVTSKNNKKYSLEELLLREKPELAVMVGDRSYDNEAARYNQIPFVGCKYGYGKPEELRECQYTIETVLELPKIIDKIVSIRGGTA